MKWFLRCYMIRCTITFRKCLQQPGYHINVKNVGRQYLFYVIDLQVLVLVWVGFLNADNLIASEYHASQALDKNFNACQYILYTRFYCICQSASVHLVAGTHFELKSVMTFCWLENSEHHAAFVTAEFFQQHDMLLIFSICEDCVAGQ